MSAPPGYEKARRGDFDRELRARARAWLPEWQPRERGADLAGAVFGITARLAGEVAQRLDRIPEKNFRGLLHWLGIRGDAGRAARVPVVFQMTPGAAAVSTGPGVQVQAAGLAEPVVFETTEPMTVTPSVVTSLFAADPDMDAYFAAPPGMLTLDPPADQQNRWVLLSDAPASSRKLQLDPPGGLAPGVVLETEGADRRQFTVTAVTGGVCDIEPAVGETRNADDGSLAVTLPGLPARSTTLRRVTGFAPFTGAARDAQQHAVYVGARQALDLEAEALISLSGWEGLDAGYRWSFWGKRNDADKPGWVDMDWQALDGGRKALRKPQGKVEEREVDEIKSRWLRGLRKSLPGEREARALSPLRLFVNCDPDESLVVVDLEGVANTTPLVLNTGFHPLGREPRLFDAFYLGSREAFSKPLARATVNVTLGDGWASPPALVTDTPGSRHLLFAVGTDLALRAVAVDETANTSNVIFRDALQPTDNDGRPLKLHPGARPGACHHGGLSYASLFAGAEVRVWSSSSATFPEGAWRQLGRPAEMTPTRDSVLETLLVRNGADSTLMVYALVDGRLHRKELTDDGAWQPQDVIVSGVDIALRKIVPLTDLDAEAGAARDPDGLLGVDAQGRLYRRSGANTWEDVTPLGMPVDASIYPSYVELPGSAARRVIAARRRPAPDEQHELMCFDPDDPDNTWILSPAVQLEGTGLGAFARGANVVAAFVARQDGRNVPAQWEAESAAPEILSIDLPAGVGELEQGPACTRTRLVHPASRGTLRVIAIDANLHTDIANAVVKTAAVLTAPASLPVNVPHRADLTPAEVDDKVVLDIQGEFALENSAAVALILDDAQHTARDQAPITLYRDLAANLRDGTMNAPAELQLEAGDPEVVDGGTVFVRWTAAGVRHTRIVGVTTRVNDAATLARPLPASVGNVKYVAVARVQDTLATLRPALEVDRKFGVKQAVFTFPGLQPRRQRWLANTPDMGATRWVVLAEEWRVQPAANESLIIDVVVGIFEGVPPRLSNPTLSWEYWDGSSWWQLQKVDDETDSFVRSGRISFCVPDDIAETEVAGRKNFWVRARLVGGDYGQESVKLVTNTATNTQTVTRSTENIRAPFINEASVSYKLCCPVIPDNLLAEDGGDFVNHGAANAEPDATIRAFVPLYASGAERAVYVGFDTPPGAQSLNLLFVVEEGAHAGAYPLRAEMRRASGFEPIDCEDGTRGLSESGIVELQFEVPPLKAGLFGRAQHWVRLLPRSGFDAANWRPVILGVYANAAMATAHETQRDELLGSSDGRPGLRVALARTPVVEKSLVLRVRERLSDEDIAELRKGGEHRVLDRVANREGPWVLWQERADLLGSEPGERVYTFQDDTGDITFGDGLNGMIPPVGRDCILAERYQRGGGDLANQVSRRTSASLITPLQGVERAAFLGNAAGGSKPDDAGRTLRFAPDRLSRRNRLLTLADLERAALEFSVDVAQALARRGEDGVELIVVMQGADPLPSAETRRALSAFLAERVSPDLAAPGAIRVLRPTPLPVDIRVHLRVEDLAHADAVRTDCERRIAALLDPLQGGFDGQGWRLGTVPDRTDVAACIEDVSHLAELVSVDIGSAPASAAHLARLADDGPRIEIDLAPGAAA